MMIELSTKQKIQYNLKLNKFAGAFSELVDGLQEIGLPVEEMKFLSHIGSIIDCDDSRLTKYMSHTIYDDEKKFEVLDPSEAEFSNKDGITTNCFVQFPVGVIIDKEGDSIEVPEDVTAIEVLGETYPGVYDVCPECGEYVLINKKCFSCGVIHVDEDGE